MKRYSLIFIFVLVHSGLFGQSSEIDSLVNTLNHANSNRDSLAILMKLTNHFAAANNEKGFFYSELLMKAANASQDSVVIVDAHLLMGKCFVFSGKFEEARDFIKRIEHFSFKNGNKIAVKTGQYLGNINRTLGDADSALYYYNLAQKHVSDSTGWYNLQRSLASMEYTMGKVSASLDRLLYLLDYEIRHNKDYIVTTANNLAVIYYNKKDLNKALKHYLIAIEEAEKFNFPNTKSRLLSLNGATTCYLELKQFDNARIYLDKSFALGKDFMNPSILSDLYYAKTQLMEGEGNLDSAMYYYDKLYQLIPQIEYYEERLNAIVNYLNFNFSQGNYYKIKPFLKELESPNGTVNLSMEKSINEILNQYYFYIKDFEKSRTYLQKFWLAKDSIEGLEQEKYISELETQYETKQKDQQIKNLTQEATIQTLLLSKKNNQLLIGGLIALFLIVAGLFFYKVQRTKKQKMTAELEQRFLRSQLNPHFIFNALASIQSYLLKKEDLAIAGKYLLRFSKLMRQILENSRSEFIPLSEEVAMLENYMELQKIRFKDNFDYEIQLEDELDQEETGIPPMFAQPFVENALEHGLFRSKDSENKVTIRFKRKEHGLIELEISDTGAGIENHLVKENHKSLATKITKERLDSYKLTVRKKVGLLSENILNEKGSVVGYRINLILPSEMIPSY